MTFNTPTTSGAIIGYCACCGRAILSIDSYELRVIWGKGVVYFCATCSNTKYWSLFTPDRDANGNGYK